MAESGSLGSDSEFLGSFVTRQRAFHSFPANRSHATWTGQPTHSFFGLPIIL